MEEIWKDVVGYEEYQNLYQVSNFGRVFSKRRNKLLKPAKDARGYLCVTLCNQTKRKTVKIHRLVALAFIPNPENKPEVNHKDEVKSNNNINNLEWITTLENINYGTRNLRAGASIKGQKRSEETKKKISEALKGEKNFLYGKEMPIDTRQKISKALKGQKKSLESIKKRSKPVKCIETGITYYSSTEAERLTNICCSSITACCKHKRRSAGGYHWEYANNE